MTGQMVDALAAVGTAMICAGIFVLFGLGWALVSGGVLLTVASAIVGYNNSRGVAGE